MRIYPYLFSYACFTCRKSFKQPLRNEGLPVPTQQLRQISDHKCPECGDNLWNMGRKFKPPRKDDEAAWQWVYEWRTQARDPITKGSLLLHRIERDAGLRKAKG